MDRTSRTAGRVPRRTFLKTAALSAGSLAFAGAAPEGAVGANDRLQFGVVGCGGMGTGHVRSLVSRGAEDNVKVVAVCDVYRRRISRAKEAAGGEAEGYSDYRKLLERKDIDAVLIATPDHWHSKVSIDAMESGKHVYCEKPLSHTVEQALAVRDAVKRLGKVLQVGPQGTANDALRKARQAIEAGRIGPVTWAQSSFNRNARVCLFNDHQRIDPTAGPEEDGEDHIDWDMWLGHEWGLAPKIDWTPEHFFRFRKYWPYNGGVATDLLYHKLAPILRAIRGPAGEYPWRVSAGGGLYIEKDGRDIPDTFLTIIDYPSQFTVFLVSTLTNDEQLPDKIYGKHGTIELGDETALRSNGAFEEEFKSRNDGQKEARLRAEPRRDMEGNFIDAVRGKDELNCNVDLGASTMVAIKLAVESYRQRKTMLWDAATEKVTAG